MDSRTPLSALATPALVTLLLATLLLACAPMLAGCGGSSDPSPGTDGQANISDETDAGPSQADSSRADSGQSDSGQADSGRDDSDTSAPNDWPDHWQNQWAGPEGPAGGTYTKLWATGGDYFTVQADARVRARLWRSDTGDTWTEVAFPADVNAHLISTIVAHDGALFLVGHEVYRSTDDGQSWQAHQWQGIDTGKVTLARVFDGDLYVIATEPQQSSRLYRIAADSAELVDGELPERPNDFIVHGETMLVAQGTYAGRIFAKSGAQDEWTLADTPQSAALGGTKLHLHGDVYYATSEAGVWRSQQGQTFEETSDQPATQAVILGDRMLFGLLAPWNYIMAMDLSDPTQTGSGLAYLGGLDDVEGFMLATDGDSLVAAMRHEGVLRMDFESEDWQQISPTLRPIVDAAHTTSHQWILTDQGKLFRSADGHTWERQPTAEHLGAQIFAHDDTVYMVSKAGDFVALYRQGDRWTLGEPVNLGKGSAVDLLGYDDVILVPFAPTILSGRGGSTAVGGGLYLADNYAGHWTDWNKIDRGLPVEYAYRQTPPVYAAHAERGLLVVVAEDGIYRSSDAGERWQKASLDSSFDASYLTAGRAWISRTEDALFAANITGSGVQLWRSHDDGATWSTVPHSLDASDTTATALDTYGSTLLMGTWKQGVLGSADGGETWQSVGEGFAGGAIYELHMGESSLGASTSAGLMTLALE